MMDREKRRKLIRIIVRFWFEHRLAIAVVLALLCVSTIITVLCVCLMGNDNEDSQVDTSVSSEYSSILGDSPVNNKRKNKVDNNTDASGNEVEQEEYSTVLQFNASTRDGYMNNCIFLGDSRTVAMVSYGFVSDENVLAKVGISHQSVLKSTFMQNSGKEYTIDKYLESHKAPVIYIGFGVNGLNGGKDEKYEKSYKEMIEHIIEKAPDSEIVIMAIWPVDDYGPYKSTCQNEWIEKYNDFLKNLAEYEGIYYLDVDSVLKTDAGQIKPEYDAGDGLHYRACAYTTILQYIVHHPVPGVSDDGEFIVKYVKPTGQFKKMMTETTKLPPNVEVVDEQTAEEPNPELEELEKLKLEELEKEKEQLIEGNMVTPTVEVVPEENKANDTKLEEPKKEEVKPSEPKKEETKPVEDNKVEPNEIKPSEEAKPVEELKPTVEVKPSPQPTVETPPEKGDNDPGFDLLISPTPKITATPIPEVETGGETSGSDNNKEPDNQEPNNQDNNQEPDNQESNSQEPEAGIE